MMKRGLRSVLLAVTALGLLTTVFAAPALAGSSSAQSRSAQSAAQARRAAGLMTNAKAARAAHNLTRAGALYKHAWKLYLKSGDAAKARACLNGLHDVTLIKESYPYDRAEMREMLAAYYPASTEAQRTSWLNLKSSESIVYDGQKHYFSDLPVNLAFRDYDLFHTLPKQMAGYRQGYSMLAAYMAAAAAAQPWQPYATPASYSFTQTLSVPRSELPATGTLRAWLPLPLEGGPQTDVRITEMSSCPWLTFPPSIDGQISLLYLRVPLAQLTGDLNLSFRVSYKHAAQYFKVDPKQVGRYDKGSDLYQTYTLSRGNIAITPDIRETARRVVGSERNPYLAAKRLYDYVLRTVKYSFMPHFALWPRGIPESVYVHRHHYGDCGAQSMYFSALCRSVGIPARTTGGFQVFTGTPSGHFWAEFYVPNYGWLPVDPTAADLVDYLPEVSAADKQAFHDFFFGNQDDLRLTVQRDVDEAVTPWAPGRITLPVAIQMPAALCDTMSEDAGLVLGAHWTFK